MKKYSKITSQALLAFVFILGLGAINSFSSVASSHVVPAKQKAFEMTYGEWSARWWQFVFGLPQADNPLDDTTGALCGKGQWGPVIFLVGTTGGDPVVRTCIIPGNKGILIPIITFGGSVPDDAASVGELSSLVKSVLDMVDLNTLTFTIDGVPVKNLENYRFQSPVFTYTGHVPNIYSEFGCAGTAPHCYEGYNDQGVAEGYWILLNPLPAGQHTIHLHGEIPDWAFTVDVTYHLTVQSSGFSNASYRFKGLRK